LRLVAQPSITLTAGVGQQARICRACAGTYQATGECRDS